MSGTDTVPDWRRLFDTIRVTWVDRGANVGRDRINIHCPWCGANDPSTHMSISTIQPTYACLRVKHHKGGHRPGLVKLLRALGISSDVEALELINGNALQGAHVPESYGIEQERAIAEWKKFYPASENERILQYLYNRGFPQPGLTCERYNLRYARTGIWAARVLLPLSYEGEIIQSWTGRAIAHHTPKYLIQDVRDESGFLYIGRTPRRIGVIVEGPFDALKINMACEQLPVSAIALTGLSYSLKRTHYIRKYMESCEQILIALDSSVTYKEVRGLKAALDFGGGGLYSRQLAVPDSYKDPGEMPVHTIIDWLAPYLQSGINNGQNMHRGSS